ncbi:GNAT family N-acetyltransferase [Natronoglycomyces albus]|uniref:GNAT family N-acetyltransferase n=1 Tax=Natronoglycomyces albus TaxID=2811108 RepID=A0A895XH16_9ACTN|nr:GNAT family N-acetyltransferase [Natronoglycomyces albus]QSB05141.1 GNAT family N-acetyltransferase [Natronoglycomyces albus]
MRDESALFAPAVRQFWAAGGVTTRHRAGTLVTHPDAPDYRMGNFACDFTTEDLSEVAELIEHTDRVVIGRDTGAAIAAHLALHDWQLEQELQLALSPNVAVEAPMQMEFQPVQGDLWDTIYRFFRLDHCEEDARAGVPTRPEAETRSGVALRRNIAVEATYYLASAGVEPEACVAIWSNHDGVGIIEDVFVHPDARGRGIATSMLRFAVRRLRGRGVKHVLIAADINDTPKHLYHRFGFRPAYVRTSYIRQQ